MLKEKLKEKLKLRVKSGLCGKFGYATEAEAMEVLQDARRARRERNKGKREKSIYPCECGHWHLTKKLQDNEAHNAPDLSFKERRESTYQPKSEPRR